MRKRLSSVALVAGGGLLFNFSSIGQFLAGRATGASVLVMALGLLAALGALSSQRLLRTHGSVNFASPSELLLTAGYGLLAASAPLAAGFFSPQITTSSGYRVSSGSSVGSPFILSWWMVALAVVLVAVPLATLRSRALLVALGSIAIVAMGFSLLLVGGVLVQGGFHGNQLSFFTLKGASWRGVVAGLAIVTPFYFGTEALVTRRVELLEEDRRFSRAGLIIVGLVLIFLQYAGVAGTDGTPYLPIDAPSLVGSYVSSALSSVTTLVVFFSCAGMSLLFAYLFARRLEGIGMTTAYRASTVGLFMWLPIVLSMLVASDLRLDEQTHTYAAMTPFLNLAAVAGFTTALGLGFGCVRAIRLVIDNKLNGMEFVPPVVGLVGLSVAAFGYLWHDTTTSTWSQSWIVGLFGVAIAGGAVAVSKAVANRSN